ncbi:nucleotidyltransferase family protein [Methanobrevibacter woesei]|uniref:nucleotidyltransferase family protein n=1 Tax=Methanobrevibacter woesei TaxID=190976 RepID=UPI0039F455AF
MSLKDFIKSINLRDTELFWKDYEARNENNYKKSEGDINLIADFTEYSPLHNGHFHCMKTAVSKVPNSIFVAIVPGLFERSGRGLPYILPRDVRAEIAISVGADIVVEGPPMGIMGSGQYSLCLARMFQALSTDFIPRGYKPFDGFDNILDRITMGHGIAPKPYKIVDMDTGEILLEDKLEEDNYVIVSFSKSLKKIGFDFKDKFIFVKRIEGVSGSLIRESIVNNSLEDVKSMMPPETISILKREINKNRAPLHNIRLDEKIIDNANNLSFNELSNLNFFNDELANKFIEFRKNNSFKTIDDVLSILPYGFSTNFNARILSILENPIEKKVISEYINHYPSVIRILDYKNEDVLDLFKRKINNENISLF